MFKNTKFQFYESREFFNKSNYLLLNFIKNLNKIVLDLKELLECG